MRWLWLPIALIVLAMSTLLLAPATWLDWALQRYSHGALTLANAEGRLWHGRGILQAMLPGSQVASLANAAWAVQGRALLKGRLQVRVSDQQTGQAILVAGWSPGGVHLDRAQLQLPAELLGRFSKTLAGLSLTGPMLLTADGVSFSGSTVQGRASLDWRNAGSGMTSVRPLGDYRLDWTGSGDHLAFALMSQGGSLALNGAGIWRPSGDFEFKGEARVAPGKEAELAPLLRMMGRQEGAGVYAINLDSTTGLAGR